MPAVIHLDAVSKTYRSGDVEVHAVRSVSLQIHAGEFVAIMGSSGSGKSSMMNMLGCLDRPTAGNYLLDGIDVSKLDRNQLADIRNQKIGFVFQGFNLLSRTSALENVILPMLYNRMAKPGDDPEKAGITALERVGLGERIHHQPNQLSGGQQQRVAIARSLVNRPALILADEPTGALDSRTSVEIMAILQQLNQAGSTIVVVTHEPDIAAYCKRIVVFKDGRVLSDRDIEKPESAAETLAALP